VVRLVEGEKANDQLLRLRQKQVEIEPLQCSLENFVLADGSVRNEGITEGKDVRFADTPFTTFCEALDDRSNPNTIVLPFDEPSNIAQPYMALRLWRAGNGKVGKMMEILYQASDLAIEKGMQKLSLRVLEAAYRDSGISDKDNWFKMEVPQLLRKFGEPSQGAL
jgi:hypothetical protein